MSEYKSYMHDAYCHLRNYYDFKHPEIPGPPLNYYDYQKLNNFYLSAQADFNNRYARFSKESNKQLTDYFNPLSKALGNCLSNLPNENIPIKRLKELLDDCKLFDNAENFKYSLENLTADLNKFMQDLKKVQTKCQYMIEAHNAIIVAISSIERELSYAKQALDSYWNYQLNFQCFQTDKYPTVEDYWKENPAKGGGYAKKIVKNDVFNALSKIASSDADSDVRDAAGGIYTRNSFFPK